ncbi:MAG TPA: hypothetical protein P5250_04560 [Bacteroidales bacterium]|nr:hypothetical protein [Bacteroidales bacterium]
MLTFKQINKDMIKKVGLTLLGGALGGIITLSAYTAFLKNNKLQYNGLQNQSNLSFPV